MPEKKLMSYDVVMAQAKWAQRFQAWKKKFPHKVLIETTLNTVPPTVTEFADIFRIDSPLQAMVNAIYHHHSFAKSVIVPLIEVPTSFWCSDLSADPVKKMYELIPRHEARAFGDFTATRIARLCYHGNRHHFDQDVELSAALQYIAENEMPLELILESSEKLLPSLGPDIKVKSQKWTGVSALFAILAECDI